MRKMKDSGIEWIGEIPEGWELIKAKYLFSQRNEKGNSTLVLLSPTQKYGVIPQSQLEGVVQVKESTDLRVFKTIHIGDFVISLRSFQGGFEFSNYEGVCSPAYQVFHATKDLSNDFFRYLFKSDGFISKINSLTVGIREGKNIQYWDFSNMLLAVPPKEVQLWSAQYLNAKCSEIDAMLSKTRSSIEEYKKLKQAVITQAVTKGVRGEREMKDSGVEWIGEIPKYWNIGKLKYYWNSVESGVSVNAADRPIDNPAQYGILKTSSVSKFIFNPHEHKQVNNDEYSRVTCPVTADCIIVSRMNTPDLVGACGYVEKTYPNLFLPDRLWQISFKNDVSAKFIWYYLNNKMVRSYISSLSTGTSSTMQNISQGQFGNISVCLPDSNEQKEISDCLDAKCAEIDKLIAKKEQLVKELESYKKSLIYEVVTGKREV